MGYFKKDTTILRFAAPSTKITVLGAVLLLISAASYGFKILLLKMPIGFISLDTPIKWLHSAFIIFLFAGIASAVIAVIINILLPDSAKIRIMIRRGLFDFKYGNPLHLKDGELLPKITCKNKGCGIFVITIAATSATVENIQDISSSISSCLNKKRYRQYAVTEINADLAFNEVTFRIEDVTVHHELILDSVEGLVPKEPTKLIVQRGTYIDLTTSGSMLVSGKTRSGKTTAIISLLIGALLAGRDKFGSKVVVIDPKQAELSRLPQVYTLDEDGEATTILNAIKDFADTVTNRQRILNDLSSESGDAVKWWNAGMKASFLFVDEYVALRSMLPKRTAKDSTDYNIDTFDGLIRRIVTMGASAGCYVIISIAEASVESGGLPSILKSAMSTKILFKPTIQEGRLMWDSDKLKNFNERTYIAGDAWFSSTDGVHDRVSFAHFPVMNFPVYAELGKLLTAYYNEI